MKTKLLLAFTFCALAIARAQTNSAVATAPVAGSLDDSAGLLGRTYSALEFGYTHHVESAPRSLRRWGFVSNRAIVEDAQNVDAAFRYNYTSGSALGITQKQHDVAVSFVGYMPLPDVKPFVRGDAGWAWRSGRGNSENAFMYIVGVGAELTITPRLAVAPFLNYHDAPDFDEDAVNIGARASYRFDHGWNGTLTLQIDDEHNIEYALGVLRRF